MDFKLIRDRTCCQRCQYLSPFLRLKFDMAWFSDCKNERIAR